MPDLDYILNNTAKQSKAFSLLVHAEAHTRTRTACTATPHTHAMANYVVPYSIPTAPTPPNAKLACLSDLWPPFWLPGPVFGLVLRGMPPTVHDRAKSSHQAGGLDLHGRLR